MGYSKIDNINSIRFGQKNIQFIKLIDLIASN